MEFFPIASSELPGKHYVPLFGIHAGEGTCPAILKRVELIPSNGSIMSQPKVTSVGLDRVPFMGHSTVFFWTSTAMIALLLVVLSQTSGSYGFDEAYHLLAARLILAGKRPYSDFFYQQMPLYPYAAASFMKVVGLGWRSAHLFSALLSVGSVLLLTRFVRCRFPYLRWANTAGVVTAILFGLNSLVVRVGTIGFPFGLCLILITGCFLLAVKAIERPGWFAFCAGLCGGGGVATSLFAVPVVPITLMWLVRQSRAGEKLKNSSLFFFGMMVALVASVWTAFREPHLAWFDVITYHLRYRQLHFSSSTAIFRSDIETLLRLLSSSQVVLLILLSVFGILFLLQERREKGHGEPELELCIWYTAALSIFAALTHPTFEQYFVLCMPFASILASLGFFMITARLGSSGIWFISLAVGLYMFGLGQHLLWMVKPLDGGWKRLELVAEEINRTVPEHGILLSTEDIYFVSGRIPPRGLENIYGVFGKHLPQDIISSGHILPKANRDKLLNSGYFDAVCLEGLTEAQYVELRKLFSKHKRVTGFDLFWDSVGHTQGAAP